MRAVRILRGSDVEDPAGWIDLARARPRLRGRWPRDGRENRFAAVVLR